MTTRLHATRSVLIAAAVAAVAFTAPADASRPATAAEASAFVEAAAHATRITGVYVPAPSVVVGDACGDDANACTVSPELVVIPARQATVYARIGRRDRLPRCIVCIVAVGTAIHEVVHTARMRGGVFGSRGYWWEEGLASAVGNDQTPPLYFRLSGWRVTDDLGCTYCMFATEVRGQSARAVRAAWWSAKARRWRLGEAFGRPPAPNYSP